MSRKAITVFSFGGRWGLNFDVPNPPFDQRTITHFVDVQKLMEDPVDKLPIQRGTDPEIMEFVIRQLDPKWLEEEKVKIRGLIGELDSSDKARNLLIGYRCKGGFQRSSAIAQTIANWLKEKFGQSHDVVVWHLTMDLTLKIKELGY